MSNFSWYVNDVPTGSVAVEEQIERARPGDGPPPAPHAPTETDPTLLKIAKLFPAEVALIYTGADAYARAFTTSTAQIVATAIVAAIGLIVLPQAFARFRKVRWSTRKGRTQIVIGTLAYAVYVYALGGLPQAVGIYNPLVSGLLVTLFVGLVALYGPTTTVNGE
jgi:hypothetical protein